MNGKKSKKLNISEKLIPVYKDQLIKAIGHLEYTRKKINTLPLKLSEYDEETLETWESFTARFARVIDIFFTKYLKARVKNEDPAFDGTLRDILGVFEKKGLLENIDRWVAMRELRNIQAHDYTDDSFSEFIEAVKTESDYVLLQIPEILNK
jgi:hypothetical protein